MRLKMIFLLAGLYMLLGISCSSLGMPSSEPSWLSHPYDKQYDEQTYLCAVGSGSSRQRAVESALSSLSQVFNSQVRSVTEVTSLSTAAQDVLGNVTFTEASQMVESGSITSETDQIVGAEVVNVYTDSLGRVHARIALHRNRTALLYNDRISQLSTSIAQVRAQSLRSSDLMRQYVLLLEARNLAREQQVLYNQLQVLLKKPQNQVLLPLERELAQLSRSIVIHVQVQAQDQEANVLKNAFEQRLQQLGFTISNQPGYPLLQVNYNAVSLELANSPYEYVRYTLDATLKGENEMYVSFETSNREAALSVADAQARALRSASRTAVDEFFALMLQTLGDQT
jgi:hypothetical protein